MEKLLFTFAFPIRLFSQIVFGDCNNELRYDKKLLLRFGLMLIVVLATISFCITTQAQTAPPVWHTTDQKTASGSGTSLSVARPDNVSAGDLIILIFTQQQSSNTGVSGFTTPSGFTLIRSEHLTNNNGTPEIIAFYKIATNSEPANYTSTLTNWGSIPNWKATAARVTGYNPYNPIGNQSGTNSGTTSVSSLGVPSLTTSINKSLVVASASIRRLTSGEQFPSGMTGAFYLAGAGGGDGNGSAPAFGGAFQSFETTGATGTKTFVWTGAARAAGLMFVINPENPLTCLNNLMINPGFESGISSWNNWWGTTGTNSDALTGKQAAELRDSDSGMSYFMYSTPGKTFTATVWTKGQNTIWGRVWIEFFTSNWQLITSTPSANIGTSTSYTSSSVSGIAPAGTAIVQIVVAGGANAGGFIRLDDFCVTTPPATPGGVSGASIWLKADTGVSMGSTFTWNDQSGNNRHGVQPTAAYQPTVTPNSINFNPALTFDGSNDYLALQNLAGLPTGAAQVQQFAVANHFNTSGNWSHIMSYGSGSTNQMFGLGKHSGTPNATTMLYATDAISSASEFLGSKPVLLEGKYTGTQAIISSFGLQRATVSATVNKTTNAGHVGVDPILAVNTNWNGSIQEIILFPTNLNAAQTNQINSYLALKYGITLDQAAPQHYIASDGSTIYWNSVSNSSHKNNIAGIVRDDASGLHQRQSQSVNPGLQVVIGNGNTIAATNAANNQNLSVDKSALIWSDNGASVAVWTTTGAPANRAILPRNWKVQETGTVGSVKLQVADNSGINGLPAETGSIFLLVDADGNFASGAVSYTMTLNGTNWEADVDFTNGQYFTFAICSNAVEVPTFAMGTTSSRCQGAATITYTATSVNNTGLTYSLDAASLAAGNVINTSTGAVSFIGSYGGTSTITATAQGCGGPLTATHTVTIQGVLGYPVFNMGASSTRCQGEGIITYNATAANNLGLTYSLDSASIAGGNSINSSTGAVVFAENWSGTTIVTVRADGCGGPISVSHNVTVTPTVGMPVFALGESSTRCQGAGTVTYTASASNSTSISYSLDPISQGAGNSINATNGQVTFVAGWSGTSIITATATGCNGPIISTHTVTITPTVGKPVFQLDSNVIRCMSGGIFNFTAIASNATSVVYSLDPASLAGGNTINSTTGEVTFTAVWNGISTVTATASGCNGPTSATYSLKTVAVDAVDDIVEGYQGKPLIIDALLNDLCDVNANSQVIISPPQFGNLQMGNNGQIIYLPAGNFSGNDEIVYQICSVTNPSICDQATIRITILATFSDPCAEATRNKTYYLPFEENNTLRNALISAGSVNFHSNMVRSVISIKIPYPGITITYDHWEDGYEANITNPMQATTRVWGDGNLLNGVAPGYPNDILPLGAYIVLDNQFQYDPRNPSIIAYDGKDKLYTRGDVAISKVTGDAGFGGGSVMYDVQNLKTNVYDVTRYGEYFVLPFGENISLGGTTAFRYTGLSVKAAENGTIVKLDYNADGVVDITTSLDEGQYWYYDGTASQPGVFPANVNNANDLKAGATVTSNKPVGIDLIFGDGFTYGTRNLALLPSLFYSNEYFSPVFTTTPTNADILLNSPVYVFFTNVLDAPITVRWTSKTATGTVIVPAFGSNYYEIPYSATGTGYRFHSLGGEPFTAVCVFDADANGSRYDWDYNLIPRERLTTFSSIAWAPGSRDGAGNYQPVWVTPTANTTVYVKFDGNMTGSSATLSPCGLPYDIAVPLNYLDSYRFYDYNDNDQSGMAIYTCDETSFTAVWGQDSHAYGAATPIGSPAMDVGYVLEPKCMKAFIFANDDYRFTEPATPINIEVTQNDFGFLTTLNPSSVHTSGLLQPANGTTVVNANGTITYTPNPGFEGVDVFEYLVCSAEYPDIICDIAKVTIRVTNCPANSSENLITGIVFVEQLPDDGTYNGENPAVGVRVELYADPNCNGIIDAGEGVIQTTNSDPSGNYAFSVQNGFSAKDDFDPTPAFNSNDGSINWSSNWIEQNDDAVVNSGYVRITPDFSPGGMGNAIRLSGNASATLRGISRSLTFSGATGAALKFNYRREALNNQGEALEVLINGTVILVINDGDYVGTDINYHEVVYPLASYNANGSNTVFFRVNSSVNVDDYFWIDNVELVYFKNPACYVVKADPSNTGGTYISSALNQQTAVFTGIGVCEKSNYLGVLARLVVADDLVNTSVDIPVLIDILANDVVGKPNPATVTTVGLANQPLNGTVTINSNGTVIYTPNAGFIGVDDFEYRVCSTDDPGICDIGLVTVTVSCFIKALQNTVTGIVYNDINLNGTRQPGEAGRSGVDVNLYHDVNANGVLNTGEPLVATATTSALGGYQLDVTPPTVTASYIDRFNTNGSATGSNGTTSWASTPWVEVNESNGFSTANVLVTGNQLRIQGYNTFYLDNFNVNTTANQTNGTTSWSGQSWIEIGESNGFSTTQITITAANGLRIAGNSTTTVLGAYRTVPLSGAGAAKLSFKATTFNLNVNSWVTVQVASSTAGPWTTLTTIQGPSTGVVTNYSLVIPTALLSATTTIRFVTNGLTSMTSTMGVFFDDVQVRYVPSALFIGAARTANLSNAVSATLSLDYAESGLDLAIEDYVDLLVSSTTVGPWTLLKRFTGADGNQSGNFTANISSFISASTTIRLVTSGAVDMTSSNIVNFDNVQITYQTPVAASYIVQLKQPIPSGYALTSPLPSPLGLHTVSFAGVGAGSCMKNFGLAGADLSVTKTASSNTILAGENITYNITVTNHGPTNATSVILTDILPAGLTLVSATPNAGSWVAPNWNIGTLPTGTSVNIVIIVKVNTVTTAGTLIANTATVSSSTPDPNPGNNSSTATTEVMCPVLFVIPGSNSPLCQDGTLQLTETGGSNVSWNWSGPGGFTSNVQNPVLNSVSTSHSGTYSVTISTINGCTKNGTVNVTVNPKPVVSLSKSSDFVCGVTAVTLTATPLVGVSYLWSSGATSNGDHTAHVLAAGTYFVTVTNNYGCTQVAQVTVDYIVCVENCTNGIDDDGNGLTDCEDPYCGLPFIEDFEISMPQNCPNLNNGAITILPNNSSWEYSINGGTTYQTSHTFTGLIPGNYYIRIRNASSGCYFDSFDNPIVLTDVLCVEICNNGHDDDGDGLLDCEDQDCQPVVQISPGATICNGDKFTISAEATGGQPPYSYIWSNGLGSGTTYEVSPLQTTTYYVTITSAAGCSRVDSVLIAIVDCPEVCTDGIDNDFDGLVDCNDPDCAIVGQPELEADIYQTCPGAVFKEQVIFNDFNLKNPVFSIYSWPDRGNVTINNNGVFTYTPSSISCEPDVFVYQVCNPAYGCCDTASVTITFGNGLPPVLVNVPPNITLGCDEQIPAAPLVYGKDQCPGIFLTYTENSTKENAGACQSYTITRTWLATNMCGNSSSAQQVITVEDLTKPELFRLYTLPNGKKMVAGISKNTSHRWKSVRFPVQFDTKPLVFSQIITHNDISPVTVRQRNISVEGFELRLQEEEVADGIHGYEEVAWIAIEQGNITDMDKRMVAGLLTNVNNTPKAFNFSPAFSATPAFFSTMQTFKDADPAALRKINLTSSSVNIFVQEEQSKDVETLHNNEDVGCLAVMPGTLRDKEEEFVAEVNRIIITDYWTTVNLQNRYTKPVVIFGGLPNGGDPALIRVRNVTPASFEVRIQEWGYLDGAHNSRLVSYMVVEGSVPAKSNRQCMLGTNNLQPGVNLFVRDNCDNQVSLIYKDSSYFSQAGLLVGHTWSSEDDCGNTFHQMRTDTCTVLKLRMKAILHGALMNNGGGNLMRDNLRQKGLIPDKEPFSNLTGFQHKGQGGGETLSTALLQVTGPDAIVDWVFLEIRNPWQPTEVLATCSALLQRDGDIVTSKGDSIWGVSSLPESYYHVAIRHRNHLGLMTSLPVYLDNSAPLVNFIDTSQPVYGEVAAGKLLNSTTRSLWPGDLNGDRRVVFQGPNNDIFNLFSHVMADANNVDFLANFISTGYHRTDFNMDGMVIYQGPNNDRSFLLYQTILAHPGNIGNLANFIVQEKLP